MSDTVARLFVKCDAGWRTKPVPADGCSLAVDDQGALAPTPTAYVEDARVQIVRSVAGSGAAAAWVLLAPLTATVLVNGRTVVGGIALLMHRDEIRFNGGSAAFSTESPACIEACTRSDAPPCPRCRQPIAPGSPAVCCPACTVWCHQTEELPCFSYTDVCPVCSTATELGAPLRWVPEED